MGMKSLTWVRERQRMGGTFGHQGAVRALQGPGHEGVLLRRRAAEVESEVAPHVGVGVGHAVVVVLGGDGRQRIGRVAIAPAVLGGDLPEHPGEARRVA
jgi:hypothetical protein